MFNGFRNSKKRKYFTNGRPIGNERLDTLSRKPLRRFHYQAEYPLNRNLLAGNHITRKSLDPKLLLFLIAAADWPKGGSTAYKNSSYFAVQCSDSLDAGHYYTNFNANFNEESLFLCSFISKCQRSPGQPARLKVSRWCRHRRITLLGIYGHQNINNSWQFFVLYSWWMTNWLKNWTGR